MMISLRLLEGININEVALRFGKAYLEHTLSIEEQLKTKNHLQKTEQGFSIAKKSRFLADGIASEFFITN